MACGVEMFCLGVSASETHSRKNTGMGTEEATRRIIATALEAGAAGKGVQCRSSRRFGCGFEGPVPPGAGAGDRRAVSGRRPPQLSLADTAGHAFPEQVDMFGVHPARARGRVHLPLPQHVRLGMANFFAAMAVGCGRFETSFGGLGGCPFTKVAAGNVATEDLVHGLQRAGQRQDVRLDTLIEVARDVAAFFGRELPGACTGSGPIAPAGRRSAIPR